MRQCREGILILKRNVSAENDTVVSELFFTEEKERLVVFF